MKNGILSRSDTVELMAKSSKSCSWWRSYFKRYGWKWDIIWRHAAKEGFIRIGEERGEEDGNT